MNWPAALSQRGAGLAFGMAIGLVRGHAVSPAMLAAMLGTFPIYSAVRVFPKERTRGAAVVTQSGQS